MGKKRRINGIRLIEGDDLKDLESKVNHILDELDSKYGEEPEYKVTIRYSRDADPLFSSLDPSVMIHFEYIQYVTDGYVPGGRAEEDPI